MKKYQSLLCAVLLFLSSTITSHAQTATAADIRWQGRHEEINTVVASSQFWKAYTALSSKKSLDKIAMEHPEFVVASSEGNPKQYLLKSADRNNDLTVAIMNDGGKTIIISKADTTVLVEGGVITMCSTKESTFAIGSDKSVRLTGDLAGLIEAKKFCETIFEKLVQ